MRSESKTRLAALSLLVLLSVCLTAGEGASLVIYQDKPAVRSTGSEPLRKLSGRVVDESNKPVGGAKVTIDFGSRSPSTTATAVTNSKGDFELLAPAREDLTLIGAMRGYAPARLRVNATRRNGLVLRLSRGLTASGRVVDEDGNPIPEALVLANNSVSLAVELQDMEPRAKSGPDGTFELQGVEPASYRLKVSHNNYASKTVRDIKIQSKPPNALPDLVLQPAAQIVGTVTDTNGEPISGANISETTNDLDTTSDEKGTFVLKGFARGTRLHLIATAAGHAEASKTVTAPDTDVSLVLPRHGTLRGRVEDSQTAAPIPVFEIRNGLGPMGKTFRQQDGNFEWKGISPGRWNFTVRAPGYQSTEVSDVEIRSGEPTEVIVFTLTRGVELAGRIVDAESGAGLSNASVVFHDASEVKSPEWQFYSGSLAQKTDENGNFKFDNLPPGKVTIIAKAPLYAEARQTVVGGPDRFVEIKLARGSSLSGRVVNPDTITPAPNASVSLMNTADMTAITSPADASGTFYFGSLTPGHYRLSAESKVGQTSARDIVLRENERLNNLVLVVKSGVTIRGRVTGLRRDESPIVEITVQASGDFIGNTSTVEGAYIIRSVPTGMAQVTALTSAERMISRSVEIPEGTRERNLDLEFTSTGRLSGRVTKAGKAVAYETVYATSRDRLAITGTGKTDANGLYVIDGLSESNYDVRLSGTSGRSVLIAGNTLLDIELSGNSVLGRVSDRDSGQPLAGVSLQIQPATTGSGRFATATTDSLGSFTVEGLDAGQYQLVAQKRGFKIINETLAIPATSPVLLSMTAAEGIAIRVRDGINGLALRNASVQIFSGETIMNLAVALDENGNGELPQLPAGRYDLRVSSSGYAPKTIVGWNVPGPPLNLSLTPGGLLEIRVDSKYVGANASLREKSVAPFNSPDLQFKLSALTVLPNLAPGEYILSITTPDATKIHKIDISEGRTMLLEVK